MWLSVSIEAQGGRDGTPQRRPMRLFLILLAVPIIGLYEISIYAAKLIERRRIEEQEQEAD